MSCPLIADFRFSCPAALWEAGWNTLCFCTCCSFSSSTFFKLCENVSFMLHYWLFAITFKQENPCFLPASHSSLLFFFSFFSGVNWIIRICLVHVVEQLIVFPSPLRNTNNNGNFYFFSLRFSFFSSFSPSLTVQTKLFQTVLIMLYKELFSDALEQEYVFPTFFLFFLSFSSCFYPSLTV